MKNEPLVVEHGGLDHGKSLSPPLAEKKLFSIKLQRVFDIAGSFDAFRFDLLPHVTCFTQNELLVIENGSLDPGKSLLFPLVEN